ncbi:MAG: Fic family protein [Microgenomates group bacterium GW2011_GWB1_40_9]|nr:MAG: Fic family protein [Microgenomates group bacterium GW2011_GWB1_40_9]
MRRYIHMNETIKLTPRQKAILNLLAMGHSLPREKIGAQISSLFPMSKATLARDLQFLTKKGFITTSGKGPSTTYHPITFHPLLAYIDLDHYFSLEPDKRNGHTALTPTVFDTLSNITSATEKQELNLLFRSFTKSADALDETIQRRELERYIIELSWKSSKIEGNTYTLLETETLIKQGQEATGRTKQEALMILNHKEAFKTIVKKRNDFKTLTLTDIVGLHNVLIKDIDITSGIRKHAVGITGTTYQPLSNEWHIKEALVYMAKKINATTYPLEKALLASIFIPYIQPFADGNKRTGRMLANAILLAYDHFPLSYRSIDENEYKKALIVFYETNNMFHVKRLFLDQYRFALKTYFLS